MAKDNFYAILQSSFSLIIFIMLFSAALTLPATVSENVVTFISNSEIFAVKMPELLQNIYSSTLSPLIIFLFFLMAKYYLAANSYLKENIADLGAKEILKNIGDEAIRESISTIQPVGLTHPGSDQRIKFLHSKKTSNPAIILLFFLISILCIECNISQQIEAELAISQTFFLVLCGILSTLTILFAVLFMGKIEPSSHLASISMIAIISAFGFHLENFYIEKNAVSSEYYKHVGEIITTPVHMISTAHGVIILLLCALTFMRNKG